MQQNDYECNQIDHDLRPLIRIPGPKGIDCCGELWHYNTVSENTLLAGNKMIIISLCY